MISTKNAKFLLIIFLAFIAGTFVGYTFSNNKIIDSKKININTNNKINNSININSARTNLSAKEVLGIAYLEARTWSEDSYLSKIELASKQFDVNGLSNGWKIVFYSKTKNKLYEILIKDGESRTGEEKSLNDKSSTQTLKGEMIDSSKIAELFYSSRPEGSDIISLTMYYDEGSKKFIWRIFFSGGSRSIDAEI